MKYMLTRRFKNFNARLSLDTFNNSMALFSNGAWPITSLTTSLMNLLCLVKRYENKNKFKYTA